MEWCVPEGEDAPLLEVGRQEIKGCIYHPLVIHSMASEATIPLCELAGMVMATAREEADRRYVITLLI